MITEDLGMDMQADQKQSEMFTNKTRESNLQEISISKNIAKQWPWAFLVNN